jgi:DNA-3-methyladenine glycosylase
VPVEAGYDRLVHGGLRPLPVSFFRRPAETVACELIGRYLVRDLDGERLVLSIVETEAYLGAADRASHAWNGRRTARNTVMWEAGGIAYVYFVYGMHHMLNVVAGRRGDGHAVLIRAGEPVAGAEAMTARRGLDGAPRPGVIAGGPARLCQALAIDRAWNGAPLTRGALRITRGEPASRPRIARAPRVGVAYAEDHAGWPLRFAARGNPHVSKPWPW